MSSTNRGSIRRDQDRYMTPRICVDSLVKHMKNVDNVEFLEPCRGEDSIYNHAHFSQTKRQFAEIYMGIDYLSPTFDSQANLIVTNPPFSLASEFLCKSLKQEFATVCYLLRLNFLGSQKRKLFWQKNPPSHLYVLSNRPSFTGTGTDSTEYAWFVWDRFSLMIDVPGIYVV